MPGNKASIESCKKKWDISFLDLPQAPKNWGSISVCTHVTVAVQVVFAVALYTVNVL